jgi:hypothetical protein
LENINEETLLIELKQPSCGGGDFERIYHFVNQHDDLTEEFVINLSWQIINHYRTSQGALCTLCLLLEKYQYLHRLLE